MSHDGTSAGCAIFVIFVLVGSIIVGMGEGSSEKVGLRVVYHEGQVEVFHRSGARRRVVVKGRRWGFTRGAAQYVIEKMLEVGGTYVLWGDTVVSNIQSYFERYFLPILRQLPSGMWVWKKQEKKLFIGESVCDFRSADRPENWEGFGYNLVILNEAGIILKNQYLWYNAVRPMLMDYPDSIVIIGGTPKGKNLFYELYKRGQEEGGWQVWRFTSYDNPFLTEADVRELASEVPDAVVRQEIYAEFIDASEQVLIPYEMVEAAMKVEDPDDEGPVVWGLDVARHGADSCVLAKRKGRRVYEVKEIPTRDDTMQIASYLSYEYEDDPLKPFKIFVETTGIGWGAYDRMRQLGLPVFPADVSLKSPMPRVLNKRAEMYVRLKEELKKGLALPQNQKLLQQLPAIEFEFDSKGDIKLVPKEQTKSLIGESPDYADAVALTFYIEVSGKDRKKYDHKYHTKSTTTSWMAR